MVPDTICRCGNELPAGAFTRRHQQETTRINTQIACYSIQPSGKSRPKQMPSQEFLLTHFCPSQRDLEHPRIRPLELEWPRSLEETVPVLQRQYRLSLAKSCSPLTSLTSERDCVESICDAMCAYEQAFLKANVLHRDISPGNIVVDDCQRRLLIDWDLRFCLDSNNKTGVTRLPCVGRMGTLQFMSAARLLGRYRRQPEDGVDDRESALYILLWVAWRYTKKTEFSSLDNLEHSYERLFNPADVYHGGKLKLQFLFSTCLPSSPDRTLDDRLDLEKLIEELKYILRVRYKEKPSLNAVEDWEDLGIAARSHDSTVAQWAQKRIADHRLTRYFKRDKNLTSSSWLVGTFQRNLKSEE